MNTLIDHTLLKPEATREDIIRICEEAQKYQFAAVCVNPWYAKLVTERLVGSGVKTCTVIGFPLGASTTETKVFEAKKAVEDGATEIDMVMNIGAFKSGDLNYVRSEISEVVSAVTGKAIVKVILETCLLSDEEIVQACILCKESGAHFVKTSTGFNSGGATIEHIKLMHRTIGNDLKIKASGGIRTYSQLIEMVEAGASRIGTSSGVKIAKEQR